MEANGITHDSSSLGAGRRDKREVGDKMVEDLSKYAHSPAHLAVARRDHASLRRIVSALPRLAKAGEVHTEAESIAAELQADEVSSFIDRRDVPGRETPLHLAVRLRDPVSAEILMAAGADWSLQNEHGWSALQEAVCTREEAIAMIIARHYQPLAWAKWCRRLPRIVASASRIRDFYMEISFHFESSVIPFIGRIAPSDTYRIWKRGSNLRADMTLAGFDGLRIQRSDQTFLFLGEGYVAEEGNLALPPGSLIALSHKEKEITNALEGAGTQPTESEVAHEVSLMSQTNMYRPGIDVTQAELVPHLNWRRQEKTEMVGNWKAKVYDMLHVMVSVKSRRVPGAMTDEELFAVEDGESMMNGENNDEYDDVLTAEERMQLDSALHMGNSDVTYEDEEHGAFDGQENGSAASCETSEANGVVKEKKSWFGWNKKSLKSSSDDPEDSKAVKKNSRFGSEGSNQRSADQQKSASDFLREDSVDSKKGKDKSIKKKKKGANNESEYKKGLRPVLWLTPDFPLKTDELLPLLDILANKVKAIRRLRELLTTKLPHGTFPVKSEPKAKMQLQMAEISKQTRQRHRWLKSKSKTRNAVLSQQHWGTLVLALFQQRAPPKHVAIPIVPTIRVLVTFTKFEELQPVEEFSTPLSSPAHFYDAKSKESEGSSSWISWMKGSRGGQSSDSDSHRYKDEVDPFSIPADYKWVDANEKKRRMKAKKARSKKHKKQAAAKGGDGVQHQRTDDVEEQ
ncbi:Ankyrin repeat domain-containing protein 13B [Glycine soja]